MTKKYTLVTSILENGYISQLKYGMHTWWNNETNSIHTNYS